MPEVGHVLGLGWADDTEIKLELPGDSVELVPKGMEVYSGDVDGEYFEPDQTPEYIITADGELEAEWSIMMRGQAEDTQEFSEMTAEQSVLAISIEEISTVSFDDIPAQEN